MFELMYFLFGLALGMVLIGNKDVLHPRRRRRLPMATPDHWSSADLKGDEQSDDIDENVMQEVFDIVDIDLPSTQRISSPGVYNSATKWDGQDDTQLYGRYKLYWFCERNNEKDPKLREMSLQDYARYKTQ